MAAIRHVKIENFRGFASFATALGAHAVLVGEPGAGRSDLIEGLIRTLDPESLRGRRGTELDLYNLDRSRAAVVEVAIGDLTDSVRSAIFNQLEFWDRQSETLVASLPAGAAPASDRHEWVVRFAYRLIVEDDQPSELVYYPKFADPARNVYPRVSGNERALIPFFWQRGLSTRPLDLAGRGELRGLINLQAGEDFGDSIDRFMTAVESAADDFSSQERLAAALQAVLVPLRSVRRFDEAKSGAELITFLPDGGARSGLLRSLAAAITLSDSPEHFPAVRQGATLLAALRGGSLHAAAAAAAGAIVVIDDFGGEFDPFVARHLAAELRRSAGQLIVATHAPAVAAAFATEEVVRLHRRAGVRQAARAPVPRTRQDRISARYLTSALVEAFNASAVVIVEGHHDRMAYAALAERAVAAGRLRSLDASGITFVEAEGDRQASKVARAARELGIFAIVVLDNDRGTAAAADTEVQECLAEADAVVRLPARMAVEELLLNGVAQAELIRVFSELGQVFGDLALPPNWDRLPTTDLHRRLSATLHNRPGSLHASYVWALDEAELPGLAISALDRIRSVAVSSQTGLVEL
jgi:ABC-type multidrug transport system fused ATPase/permease subunit